MEFSLLMICRLGKIAKKSRIFFRGLPLQHIHLYKYKCGHIFEKLTCILNILCVDKSQRKNDTECSFIQENSISCESGQADISSKIPNKTGCIARKSGNKGVEWFLQCVENGAMHLLELTLSSMIYS